MVQQRSLVAAVALLLLAASTAEAGCIMDTMKGYQELAPLVKALEATKLGAALNTSSSVVTLFAPTDVAFQKLSLITGLNASDILGNANGLTVALAYHLLSGAYTSDMLKTGLQIPTLLSPNDTLVPTVVGQGQFAAGTYITSKYGTPARVVTPNIKSPDCLSIVHIVDEFLLANQTGSALGINFAE